MSRRPFTPKVVTANALLEGDVVWLKEDDTWTRDIAEAVSAAGYPLEKAEVRLPNGALRNTGEFDVAVHLHTDVETTLKLIIVAE